MISSKNKNFSFQKEILLTKNQLSSLNFCFIKTNKLILFKNQNNKYKYLYIPYKVDFNKKEDTILFYTKNSNQNTFFTFINIFSNWLKSYNKILKKILIIKGLGLRINISEDKELFFFKFKLGFSHLIEFNIPKEKTNVLVKKNVLSIKGDDIVLIGNICKKIKSFKLPNAYNAKGFWYKNEKIICKTFKKK